MKHYLCDVCGNATPETTTTIIQLTEAERATLLALQGAAQSRFAYCKGCYGVLKDPKAGAQALVGALEHSLQLQGISDPEFVSKWHTFLKGLSK